MSIDALTKFAEDLVNAYAAKGVQFVIGRLKSESSITVQSILFDNASWNVTDAREWLGDNDFISGKLDETEAKLRFRQKDPKDFEQESFRTINAGSKKKNVEEGGDHIALFNEFDLFTGETEFHVHEYNPSASFTAPPFGLDGHRHALERDNDGRVISFGVSANHMHELNEFAAELLEMSAHMGGRRKKIKRKKLTRDSNGEKLYDDGDMHTLEGVEIFRAGTWNGDKYTVVDLDAMVDAFGKVGFTPAVKLGHEAESGERAWGWIDNIKRIGESLFADLRDITNDVYLIIKEHGFDRVSSEIIWDFERNGEVFRRVLSAVALLGSEVPAVNLLPLRDATLNTVPDDSYARKFVYTMKLEEVDMSKVDDLTLEVSKLTEDLAAAKKTQTEAEAKLAEAEGDKKAVKEATEAFEVARNTIEELTTKLTEAQEGLDAEAKSNADKVTELTKELTASKLAITNLQKHAAEADERERKTRIDGKVEGITIPALRPYMTSLYNLVTKGESKKVNFSIEKDKDNKPIVEELEGEAIIDKLLTVLNETGNKLFKQLSVYTDQGRNDDPDAKIDVAAEVHKKAEVYMEKSGEKDLSKAYAKVLADNEDLRIAYAQT